MPLLHKPEQIVLSNGIPVILQQYDGPAAATYWWVKTGSADEAKDEAGFAHFLEHMLFKDAAAKDTGRASTGQMARSIESLGGDINAYTSFDQTVYHVTCASHHWERVIDAFGPMAKPQRFLKEDFEREREVIIEELRKNEDSPGRQVFQNLFTSTFAKHPYGRPVIGYVKTLKAANVQKLEAFYKRNYVSSKMGVILVGPISEKRESLIKLVEKHFGSKAIPKKAATETKRVIETELRKDAEFSLKPFDVKTPKIALAFRVPDLKHGDIAPLDLATGILGMGELSRLYQKLFYGGALVTDTSGGLYVPNDPGMMYFEMDLESLDQMLPATEALLNELDRGRRENFTDEEIQRVLTNSESERLYATQSADGMAGRIGFLKFVVGDLTYDGDYLEALRSVDADRIRETLAKYLDVRRMSVAIMVPKDAKDYDMEPLKKLVRQKMAPMIADEPKVAKAAKGKTAKKSSIGAEPQFFTRPSGLQVVHRENLSSHVISVHASVLGGLRLEIADPIVNAADDWGSSSMMALTWTKGTQQKDARAIARLIEGSAAGLDGFSGRNTVGLNLTGLSRDWEKLTDAFAEVLVDPTFPDSEVDHSRRVAEDSVRSIEDHTAQLCSRNFLEALYEKHPYGKLTIGSLESLAKIDGAKLKSFHRRWVRPERMVVSVSGNVRGAQLEKLLDRIEARFASAGGKAAAASKTGKDVAPEQMLKGPRWVERNLGREQSHIMVGGLGTTLDSEDRHALRLMQTILGGQSGRLFIELREKKSLAYTVAPVSFEGMEPGYAGTYIACSPGKRQEAIDGIRTVLEKLAQKGPTAEEMKRAKEFFLGRRAMDMQSDSSIATHLGLETLYGLKYETDAEVIARTQKLSAKAVQDVCRRYLVEPKMVHSIVI